KGKQIRSYFNFKNIVSTYKPLKLLHFYLFGLTKTTLVDGKCHEFIIVYDYTRWTCIISFAHKDESFKDFFSSRSWELCFRCLTLVECYPLIRLTRWCETSQNPLCCSQLSVIMTKDKVITLGPNELPNLVNSYHLDDHNYLQRAQYIHTTFKGHKKLSHIEGNDLPRDDPKFEAWDDEDSLIMTWL
ncbi:hypothetical protein CR513_10456, partial [Mucuna pruriens]